MDTMTPSSFGFADDGQAWEALGKIEGFFIELSQVNPRLAEWFATGDFTRDIPPRPLLLPKLSSIHPVQSYIVPATVAAYEAGDDASSKELHELFPTLFRYAGKTFVYQGTHRLAAYARMDAASYTGWFINLDRQA